MLQQSKQLEDTLKWLVSNGYVEFYNEDMLFTEKCKEECRKWLLEKHTEETKPVVQNKSAPAVLISDVKDWPLFFMQFIAEAKVPARIEIPRSGEVYFANKYSEKAMLIFKKALESGTDYTILLRSVQLYYKSSVGLRKAIGNYFIQGDWRSGYMDMVSAMQSKEMLTEHIKSETHVATGSSNYKLG